MTIHALTTFSQLALKAPLLKALDAVGYETPSPIQAETIPLLLKGKDIIGQAQTGTGKTAAFALPLLSNLDLKQRAPQILVLTPTRELAIQVAEAFQKYASNLKGFHVLPIYGGQDYRGQIRGLQRAVHVVVGTPGRIMDHMRRKTLKLKKLSTLVLDEADEMLRMGFIDDVEWILEQTPDKRQIALFSATMPQQVCRIATKYLDDPAQITIKNKTTTVDTIRQRYWPVSGMHKLDALTRILEVEPFDGMLIFVRTKTSTVELAEKLQARGYSSSPINGDMAQRQRERAIAQLKNGKLDILVATDVAARGLDVERISHVVNYDIPCDTESYVHRIGRTGRAGRAGDAILFVAPRERRMLSAIEKATRKSIEKMELPSTQLINDKRIEKFKQRITDTLAGEDLEQYCQLVEQYEQEHNVPAHEVAAALAKLAQGDTPLLLEKKPAHKNADRPRRSDGKGDGSARRKAARKEHGRPAGKDKHGKKSRPNHVRPMNEPPEDGMQRYRIEVGNKHNVKPGNIVGAIANEAGLDGKYIGRISIQDDHSFVDLPDGMPKDVYHDLKKTRLSGQKLNISHVTKHNKATSSHKDKAGKRKKHGKKESDPKKRKRKKKVRGK